MKILVSMDDFSAFVAHITADGPHHTASGLTPSYVGIIGGRARVKHPIVICEDSFGKEWICVLKDEEDISPDGMVEFRKIG